MIVHGHVADIWDGQLRSEVSKRHKISICTTCMGRTHDLVQTLPRNIEDNDGYPEVEFVVLDYNSRDGLGEWVAKNCMPWIESGRLVYARTTEPQWFHMAHSRNVAFKLASGDIVCNVDADNWTGVGFAEKVNLLANERPTRAIFAKGKRLLHGRIGFYKNEWQELLGGYDEDLMHYGHDDRDLMNRALILGFRLMWFGGQYVTRIKTRNPQKVANMQDKRWRTTEDTNRMISAKKIEKGILKSNQTRSWGSAILRKNFAEDVIL